MGYIVVGVLFIVGIDLIPLIRRGAKTGIAAFSVFAAVALTMAIFRVTGAKFPSVMVFLRDFVRSIGLSY